MPCIVSTVKDPPKYSAYALEVGSPNPNLGSKTCALWIKKYENVKQKFKIAFMI